MWYSQVQTVTESLYNYNVVALAIDILENGLEKIKFFILFND